MAIEIFNLDHLTPAQKEEFYRTRTMFMTPQESRPIRTWLAAKLVIMGGTGFGLFLNEEDRAILVGNPSKKSVIAKIFS